MKSVFLGLIISFLLAGHLALGSDYFPEYLLKMDRYFSHHVVIAEKSTHKLHLYTQENGQPKLVKTYQMATGKKAGNKIFQGDHRTPEGIYNFTSFLTHEDLIKRHGKAGEIYGVGAFVMNYPNPIDQLAGKTGGGIWLHSTNDETRIDKGLDSRGCVVTANSDLIEISKYIELNKSNIIVTHELKFLEKTRWEEKRTELNDTLENWANAWRNEDFKQYISHYHPRDFTDPHRGGFDNFKSYKRAVFYGPGKPEIDIENISILTSANYATITFLQNYRSQAIQDIGKKTLYLKRDEYYRWKIVAERWSKHGLDGDTNQVAFRPSMRFFKSTDPKNIIELKSRNQATNN